ADCTIFPSSALLLACRRPSAGTAATSRARKRSSPSALVKSRPVPGSGGACSCVIASLVIGSTRQRKPCAEKLTAVIRGGLKRRQAAQRQKRLRAIAQWSVFGDRCDEWVVHRTEWHATGR